MFVENLPKRDPCLENFGLKILPIWAAHTCTLNMLYYPPRGGFNSPRPKKLHELDRTQFFESKCYVNKKGSACSQKRQLSFETLLGQFRVCLLSEKTVQKI